MKHQNKTNDIDLLNQQIGKFRPISKDLLRQIKEFYRIGFTYSSNAIEGNTLTESETKVVLEDGLTIAGKPLRDHYEASGHSDAFEKIYDLAKSSKISEKDILEIHRLFYFRIDKNNAGVYRKIPVVITGTDFIPPHFSKIPNLMKALVKKMAVKSAMHPVEYAATWHLELVNIHPFVDGNGRTARLVMNLSLLQAGYCITIIPPILRADYHSLLKKAQTGKMVSSDFLNFISERVFESTKDYLRLLRKTH